MSLILIDARQQCHSPQWCKAAFNLKLRWRYVSDTRCSCKIIFRDRVFEKWRLSTVLRWHEDIVTVFEVR
jgi:hypothetical protein